MTTSGAMTAFRSLAIENAQGITVGPDGDIWIGAGAAIARVTVAPS